MTHKQLQCLTSYFHKEKQKTRVQQKENPNIHLRQAEGKGTLPSPGLWNRGLDGPTAVKPLSEFEYAAKTQLNFRAKFGTIDRRFSSPRWSKTNYVVEQSDTVKRNQDGRVIHAIGEEAYRERRHTNEITYNVRHRVHGGCHNEVDAVPNTTREF